jgi:hypothetical protein
LVAIDSHRLNGLRAGVVQIHQDIAGILFLRVGLNIHVTAFAVAHAQEADGRRVEQLRRGPQPLSGERSSGLMVNQSNQIEVMRQTRELAAHGLQSQMKSTVEHGPILESAKEAVQ